MVTPGSPGSGSPKRWGVGGCSPILPTRSHHIGRSILAGAALSPASRGSPMPSRPPHLPHPRSRSLDTALDKATDAPPVMADSTPQCSSVAGSLTGSLAGSVTGSLTDSTVPESVPASTTDSVAEATLPSDTDASDSGISNRCSSSKTLVGSSRDSKRKDSFSDKHSSGSKSKEGHVRSSFRRAHGSSAGSKEDVRSSGRLRNKSVKNTSNAPSGKERLLPDSKAPLKSSLPKGADVTKLPKAKIASADAPAANKFNHNRSFFRNQEKDATSKEIDPYANFLKKKNSFKSKESDSKPSNSPLEVENQSRAESSKKSMGPELNKGYVPVKNPYISPLISNFGRKERSPQPSCSSTSSSPVPSSVASGLRSPSLISSSSTASLPQKRKESVFSFPTKSNEDVNNQSVGDNRSTPKVHNFIPIPAGEARRNYSPQQPHRTFPFENVPMNTVPKPKETSSPFQALKTKSLAKPIGEIDLHKEGSHLDLVASCEQYLEDERQNTSEDESTLASTRRSSVSSVSSSNGRRRRRLSSIPLDDELTITEEDNFLSDTSRQSPSKSSDASHEMAIFSAIAALSHSGSPAQRADDTDSCGEYEGCSPISGASKSELKSISSGSSALGAPPSSPGAPVTQFPSETPSSSRSSIASGTGAPSKSITMPRTASSDTASLLDKYVNKVKTFIKK